VSDVATRVGENLYRHRIQAGISQEELGERADLHRTQISLLESGGRMPRVDTLVKLAGSLGVSPCDLLDGIVWRPRMQAGGFKISTSKTRRKDAA